MASLTFMLTAATAVQAYTNIDSKLFMRKNINLIVVPGEYKSHMHSFFGSYAVTLSTNSSEQLRQGCHTSSNPYDFSVYWIPTLYAVVNNEHIPVEPNYFKAYHEKLDEAEIPCTLE